MTFTLDMAMYWREIKMDPSLKKLLLVGVLGLVVTWGTFIALELAPHSTSPETEKADSEKGLQAQLGADRSGENIATSRGSSSTAKPTSTPASIRRSNSAEARASRIDKARRAAQKPRIPGMAPHVAALGEGAANSSSDRFTRMEKIYESENRDSLWADEKEKRILDLFKKGNYEHTLIDISCRKTLCKMEVRIESRETLFSILKLPGLAEEVGVNAATKPFGDEAEKRIVSFLTRK